MMNDRAVADAPAGLAAILDDTKRIGFGLASEPQAGSLLRALAATKPGGRLLELGTGTGVGTAWMLGGMDAGARLISVDSDPAVQEVARRHLGRDPRVTFHAGDGGMFLDDCREGFDLIYADAWPGKFTHLDRALSLVKPGGIYFIDDLLPQPSWPEGHAPKVPLLVANLEARREFVSVRLEWSSGLMILVRLPA
jgi:predicted O-methyltransferase YrrM